MKKWLGLVLLAVLSAHAEYRFGSVALGGGGFVTGILTSPTAENVIFARTDVGGAYRWVESSKSWTPITDWISADDVGLMGVESFATDPQNPQKLYLLLGTSYFSGGKTVIARSNDTGKTFQVTEVSTLFKAHGNGSNRHTGEKLAVDPNQGNIVYCGSRANGLFKSVDAGVSWQKVNSFPASTTANGNGVSFVLFDPNSGTPGSATQTIYVGMQIAGGTNFYVSQDGGATWNAIANAPTEFMPERAKLASNGNMFITYGDANNSSGAIYRYNTQGSGASAWTSISPQAGKAFGGISVDAQNPERILASTFSQWQYQTWGNGVAVWGDRVFISLNGGDTWTDLIGANKWVFDANGNPWIRDHALHWAGSIEIDPFHPDRAFVISGNGLFMTENLSASTSIWKFMCKGLEETVPFKFAALPGKSAFYYVIGDYNGAINTHLDSVPDHVHTPGLGTTPGLAFAWNNPDLIARAASEIYLSSNMGGSWTKLTKPATAGTVDLAMSADGVTLLWATDAGTVWKGTQSGTSWTQSTGINFNSRPAPDLINSSKFYVYNPSTGAFFVSTNSGSSFAQVSSPGTGGNARIRAVPGYEGDIWIAMYNGGLTRSKNSGSTFTKLATIEKCTHVGFGKAAPGKSFPSIFIWGTVNNVVGMFRSDDEGATWVRINDDQHQYGGPGNAQMVDGDINVYGRFYMSTVGRGIVYGDLVPENHAPTNVILSADSVAENLPAGSMVGTLSTTDSDAGETFTYSLVGGTGSDDNSKFSILGNQLKTATPLDYEYALTRSIRVRSTDKNGLWIEKVFLIRLLNDSSDDAPVRIANKENTKWNDNDILFWDLLGRELDLK